MCGSPEIIPIIVFEGNPTFTSSHNWPPYVVTILSWWIKKAPPLQLNAQPDHDSSISFNNVWDPVVNNFRWIRKACMLNYSGFWHRRWCYSWSWCVCIYIYWDLPLSYAFKFNSTICFWIQNSFIKKLKSITKSIFSKIK